MFPAAAEFNTQELVLVPDESEATCNINALETVDPVCIVPLTFFALNGTAKDTDDDIKVDVVVEVVKTVPGG